MEHQPNEQPTLETAATEPRNNAPKSALRTVKDMEMLSRATEVASIFRLAWDIRKETMHCWTEYKAKKIDLGTTFMTTEVAVGLGERKLALIGSLFDDLTGGINVTTYSEDWMDVRTSLEELRRSVGASAG